MNTGKAIGLSALGLILYKAFSKPKPGGSTKGLGKLYPKTLKGAIPSWNEFRSGKPLHYKGYDNRNYIATFKDNSDLGLYSIKFSDENGRQIRNPIMRIHEIENFYYGIINEGTGLGSLGALKKYKWQPAYIGDKSTLGPYNGKSGVYLIKEGDKIIYVGKSGYNLYKTISRHFQTWNDRRPRIVYYNRKLKIRVILCTSAQADKLEKALILKHNPRDNSVKYESYQFGAKDQNVYNAYKDAIEEEVPF